MKEQVGFCQFCDRFRNMGRNEQFSYNGKKALFEYLEALEEDLDEEIDLDVIALCCEYTEYESIKEYQEDYGDDYKNLDSIEQVTMVIRIEGKDSFIIQQF